MFNDTYASIPIVNSLEVFSNHFVVLQLVMAAYKLGDYAIKVFSLKDTLNTVHEGHACTATTAKALAFLARLETRKGRSSIYRPNSRRSSDALGDDQFAWPDT